MSRNDDDDIKSGNVWPEQPDQDYVDDLERRIAELELQLEKAEQLLARHDALTTDALSALDGVVARLTAEEYGPPPRSHPAFGGHDA
jgi:hypothetical protein